MVYTALGHLLEVGKCYTNTLMSSYLHQPMSFYFRGTKQSDQLLASPNHEPPPVDLEWCVLGVEVEAQSPIMSHSCCRLVRGMVLMSKHSHDTLSQSTHVVMLQKY